MRWGFVMLVATLVCSESAAAATTVVLAPDRAAPQVTGTRIRWRATASGDQSPYVFKWWLWDGASWRLVRDWGNAAVYDWVPGTASAAYRVRVWVRSARTKVDQADATQEAGFVITSPPVSGVTLSTDVPAPQVLGARVRFTATATGGTAPLSYRWWLHDGSAASLLADWASSNVLDWTPVRANDAYHISVWVRSANSTLESEGQATVAFPVRAPLPECVLGIEPAILGFGNGGGPGATSVVTSGGCAWQVRSQASWITLESPSSATGPATVSFTVAPNTEGVSRTGTIAVGEQILSVTQGGSRGPEGCSYAVFPTAIEAGFGNEAAELVVTAPPGCAWAVEEGSFVRASRSSGEGTQTVGLAIENNTSPEPRATVVMVAGRAVTVAQAGRVGNPPGCSYEVTPAEAAFDFQAQSGEVRITTSSGCGWTATSNHPNVHIVGPTAGTGSGTLRYALDANGTLEPRAGLLVVAGRTVTIQQAASPQVSPCVYSLSESLHRASYAGGPGAVGVFTSAHCEWGVTSNVGWVRVTEVSESQGNGSVWFTVDANPGDDERSGTVVVAGQALEVSQAGVPRTASAGEIRWSTPPDEGRVGECAGNCGAGCSDFFNPCGGPHHWEREVLTEPQYVGDDWEPVCSGGSSWFEVRPRYTAVVRWTFHGLRSSLCAQHDASCRALELIPGVDRLLCLATAALVGLNGFNYCDGAELHDWSYEFVDVGHGPVAAYIDGAPSC